MGEYRWLWMLLLFAGLVTWKFDRLTLPPYEDQALAVWAEAEYLAKTGFDYYSLRYEETNFMEGGEYRSFMISILPTLIAAALVGTGSIQTTITLAHVVNLFLVAVVTVQIARWLAPTTGRLGAVLVAIAWLTLPAMVCPIETVGMEVPLIAAACWPVSLFFRGRYVASAFASVLPFLMKASGALVTLTGLAYVVLLLLFSAPRSSEARRSRLSFALASYLVVLAFERMLMKWSGDPVLEFADFRWPEIFSVRSALEWCPDLVALVALLVLLAGIRLWRELEIESMFPVTLEGIISLYDRLGALLLREHKEVFSLILTLGTLAATAQYIFIVRYLLMSVAFLMVALGLFAFADRRYRPWASAAALMLIAGNWWNEDGRLYQSVPAIGQKQFARNTYWVARSCAFLERSGEYRADHEATIRLARQLEAEVGDGTIFADGLYGPLLRRPMLGYVRQPLPDVVDTRDFSEVADRLVRMTQQSTPVERVYWLSSSRNRTTVPTVASVDGDIVFHDGYDPPTEVYHLSAWPTGDRQDVENWYLAQTWRDGMWAQRVVERINFLKQTGRGEEIRGLLRTALRYSTNEDRMFYPIVLDTWFSLPKVNGTEARDDVEGVVMGADPSQLIP